MKYYFLVTYLPEIHRDDRKLKLRFGDLLAEREHIDASDWREIELLLLGGDIFLLEQLLAGKDPEVEHTFFGKEFWKEQVRAPKEAPPFLEEFLKSVVSEEAFGPAEVNELYGLFYDHVRREASTSLLRDYFQFEKDLRNVLVAVRARRQDLSPADHLVGSGELVEQLGGSNADDFGLGQDLPWIESLLDVQDPLQLEDTVEQVLWDHLEERIQQKNFEFDVVLAYLLKLQLLEKRLALSEERGMEIVRELEGL
jgi:hypothetical protein